MLIPFLWLPHLEKKKLSVFLYSFKDQWNSSMLPGPSMYYFSCSQAYSEVLSQINFEGCVWFTLLSSWLFFSPRLYLFCGRNRQMPQIVHGSIFREEKLYGSLRLSVIFYNPLLDTEPESISLPHTMVLEKGGIVPGKICEIMWGYKTFCFPAERFSEWVTDLTRSVTLIWLLQLILCLHLQGLKQQ